MHVMNNVRAVVLCSWTDDLIVSLIGENGDSMSSGTQSTKFLSFFCKFTVSVWHANLVTIQSNE